MSDVALRIQVGFATSSGRQKENRDFVAACVPTGHEQIAKGSVIAVADGVSAGLGGREAAEISVRGLMDGYYSLPATLSVERAAARALTAVNRWIHTVGVRDPTLRDMATTLSAIILCRRQVHIVHVGDTRVWRLRQSRLQLLTNDHTRNHPDLRHVLIRAIGLEDDVRADYAIHALQPHDRFLICSDGVHGVLNDQKIQSLLDAKTSPTESAERLVAAAHDAGSHDNITAAVVDVIEIPVADHADIDNLVAGLPLRDVPDIGDRVDDFILEKIIADGRYSRLFLAHDQVESRKVIVKFPQARVGDDETHRKAFTREAWIGARAHSPFLCEVIELPPGRQTRLYSVLPFYDGETLEQYLLRQHRPNITQCIDIATKLAKAVYALHRRGIIHRDIKPDNVLMEGDAGLRLLDFGVARIPALDTIPDAAAPGTPSYMAPELFRGEQGDVQSDVYALGVTLYRMLTRHFPYGEIEPFSTPRFSRYVSIHHYRPDLPAWLDNVLAKAVHADKTKRYGDTIETVFALEQGLVEGGYNNVRKLSLYDRSPLLFWQLSTAMLAVALLASLAF